jgi:hypothetical protein
MPPHLEGHESHRHRRTVGDRQNAIIGELESRLKGMGMAG